MANPQHIEWLLEGVEAWNTRREREEFKPDFEGADIRAAFNNSDLLNETSFVPLRNANLESADLRAAGLGGAVLTGANLRNANLTETELWGSDLRRADLRGTNLNGADLRGAKVRTSYVDGTGTPEFSDLCESINLSRQQIISMDGDTGTILPKGTKHPEHWPSWQQIGQPDLPNKRHEVTKVLDEKVVLSDLPPPSRLDLEAIHRDMREDILSLRATGSFDNISKSFSTAFTRLSEVADEDYENLDQIRFGVQASAMRLRFESNRGDFKDAAPEKIGDLEAVLRSAELLAARLPKWREFLAETQDDRDAIKENADTVDEAVGEAAEKMLADPDHYEELLSERIAEYWHTKTTEAYIAATTLLSDVAYVVIREVNALTKDTMTEARKIAIKGLATTLVTGLGSIFAKLAGIVPAEFEWILPWLKYIPTILG